MTDRRCQPRDEFTKRFIGLGMERAHAAKPVWLTPEGREQLKATRAERSPCPACGRMLNNIWLKRHKCAARADEIPALPARDGCTCGDPDSRYACTLHDTDYPRWVDARWDTT